MAAGNLSEDTPVSNSCLGGRTDVSQCIFMCQTQSQELYLDNGNFVVIEKENTTWPLKEYYNRFKKKKSSQEKQSIHRIHRTQGIVYERALIYLAVELRADSMF